MTDEQPAPRIAAVYHEGDTYYGILDDSQPEYSVHVIDFIPAQVDAGFAAVEMVVTSKILVFNPDEVTWRELSSEEWTAYLKAVATRQHEL